MRTLYAEFTLSTGTVVRTYRADHGEFESDVFSAFGGGDDMTSTEWDEYAHELAKENARRNNRRHMCGRCNPTLYR